MCRDQNIEVADWRTTFGENGPDSPELKSGILPEVDDLDSRGFFRVAIECA